MPKRDDRDLPGGTVTFLLTDVDGSIALWEAAPDAMRAALARHDTVFEDEIAEHGGVQVCLATDRAQGHRGSEGSVLNNLGHLALLEDDLPTARCLLRESLLASREAGAAAARERGRTLSLEQALAEALDWLAGVGR